jgi:hypothetical protein
MSPYSKIAGPQLTLGGLIEALERADGAADVVFDFDREKSPFAPHSYRGYYEDLAFEPGKGRKKVRDLLAEVGFCVGTRMEGYKGGIYPVDLGTYLWCAEWGCCGRAIVRVEDRGRELVLITQGEEEG